MRDDFAYSSLWHTAKAPDEEALPFKAMLTLAHSSLSARVLAEPEHCHPSWNNLLLAVKRAGLQPTLLIATLMTHVNHGPYSSGRTFQTKQDVCEDWIDGLSQDEFAELQEHIAMDRCCDLTADCIPATKEDLMREPTIAARGIFAAGRVLVALRLR